MPRLRTFLLPTVLLLALFALAMAAKVAPPLVQPLEVFAEAMELVRTHYVREVSISNLVEKALDFAAKQLDEHCAYLPPDRFEHVQDKVRGIYGGVGLLLTMRSGEIVVAKTVEGMPAHVAGIQPGDVIRTLNGRSVAGLSISEIVSELKGPLDTRVTVGWERDGKEFSAEMARSRIVVDSVEGPAGITPKIGLITIHEFADRTRLEMEAALEKFSARGYRKLILDLRDNPGGTLEASCAIADLFLPEGKLIVTIQGRGEAPGRLSRYTQKTGIRLGAPVAILVNHDTVSGAEILAAALRDHGRADVIGEGTYGKGSVQTVFPLRNGAALKLTTQHYFSPNGEDLDLEGVHPDISVEDDRRTAGVDPILRAAVGHLEKI